MRHAELYVSWAALVLVIVIVTAIVQIALYQATIWIWRYLVAAWSTEGLS